MLARFRAATTTTPEDPTRRAIWRRVQHRTERSAIVPWVVGFALAAAAVLIVALGWRAQLQRQRHAERAPSQAIDHAAPRPDARAAVIASPQVAEPPSPVAAIAVPAPELAPLLRPRAPLLPQTPR
ncbi:MAG: hypothetical protein K1X88_09210, partial [Nannocystaceae bacterium]|nr:hypothetical protein [Nannocystaceae bacterium]